MNSQAFNITTVLADRLFTYSIAPEDYSASTSATDHEQDPFAYITTERYTPKEFYGIIIDTGASKKSTAGYRQYLTYKATTNNNADINTTQTGAVTVQFGIGLTALIRLVAVKTPIGLVDFHVVKADTLIGPAIGPGSKHVTPAITRQFGHPFLMGRGFTDLHSGTRLMEHLRSSTACRKVVRLIYGLSESCTVHLRPVRRLYGSSTVCRKTIWFIYGPSKGRTAHLRPARRPYGSLYGPFYGP